MTEQCCEYLSVRCIWRHVLIMSRTCFRVNPHSIVPWMSINSLLEVWSLSDRNRRTDKYSQHSSIIWPVLLNGWEIIYELSTLSKTSFMAVFSTKLNLFLPFQRIRSKFSHTSCTAQKMKFSINDFFSKCDQIAVSCRFGHICWRNP